MPPQETWLPFLSNEYTPDDIANLRAESHISHTLGVRWQDRGPIELLREQGMQRIDPTHVVDTSSLPKTWRGQPLRQNTLKYAKRGGKKVKSRKEKAQALGGYNPLWKGGGGGGDRHDHDRPGSSRSMLCA